MRRGLDPRVLLPGALLLVSLSASCADTYAQGNAPPATSFYYPSAVAVVPTQSSDRFALVSNTNFDLRFAAGWLSVVDLQVLQGASSPRDTSLVRQQLRVPSFAGPIAIDTSTPIRAGDAPRLAFIAHRGTRLLTAIEVSVDANGVPTLSCGRSGSTVGMGEIERRTDCDLAHFYDLSNPTGFDAVDPQDLYDPFAITLYRDAIDGTEHLAVSFLSHFHDDTLLLTFAVGSVDDPKGVFQPEHAVKLGAATVAKLLPQPNPANIQAPSCNLHPVPPETLSATCVRTRLISGNFVYGAGTDSSLLRVVTIDGTNTATLTRHLLSTDVGGTAISGFAFSPDGSRAFVVNRSPDSLVSVDMTLATPPATTTTSAVVDQPRFGLLDVLPLGSQPSDVTYIDRAPIPLVAVPRFRAKELDVVASAGDALVSVAVVTSVGSGPFATATWREASGDDFVLVSTFFDHGLSVVRIPAGDAGAASLVRHVRSAELGDATTY